MSMKHTPGPWSIGAPKRVLGCDARGQLYIHAKDVTIAAILDGDREANAHLIKAAPDLLAALRGLVERGTDSPQHQAAEAAIAKATGETP